MTELFRRYVVLLFVFVASLPLTARAADWTLGDHALLYIRADFADLPGVPISDADLKVVLADVETYLLDNSNGRYRLKCTFSPTVRLPRPASFYEGNRDQEQIIRDAREAARKAGFDTAPYSLDVVAFRTHGGGESELAAVGGKGTRILNNFRTGITLHAIGHNLGLPHSSFWQTDGSTITGLGTRDEYGDGYDPMGGGGNADVMRNHLVLRAKRMLGWLDERQVPDATAGGTFRLFPQDLPGPGIRGLTLRRDDGTDYWIEFRQRITDDAGLMNGVRLLRSYRKSAAVDLLSMKPASPERFRDAPLRLGQTFADAEAGIYVTPVSINATQPRSIDVVIKHGTPPKPRNLTFTLKSDSAAPRDKQAARFSADGLAAGSAAPYVVWDFGDGQFATGPQASHAWEREGYYRVTCTAADGWGRVQSRGSVVTVGRPAPPLAKGVVLDGAAGLSGVTFEIAPADDATRQAIAKGTPPADWKAFTGGDDGRFQLFGLPDGDYFVRPRKTGYAILPAKVHLPSVPPLTFRAAKTANSRPGSALRLTVRIDGREELRITPDRITWNHLEHQWPAAAKINGVAIDPRGEIANPLKDQFARGRANVGSAVMTQAGGRGTVDAYLDGDAVVLSISDPQPGAAAYDVTISFAAR